ncbi:MAG: FAD-dependent oxidoreductase [Acidobacteriota bacterium]|nr:FAD-dependent oxidoreductase [Acidobacteriota bacterium]
MSASDASPAFSIAVVGGGVTGLAAAETLRREGANVTVYERESRLGGLCSGTEIGGLPCDRFYHVVLPSDLETLAWIRGLGLEDRLVRSAAGSGFYGRGRLVPLATSADFLRFPFLSFPRKIQLGAGILRAALIADPSGPASTAAELWLKRRFGTVVTERIWMPLLRSKLGEAAPRASAAFIWASIRRLMAARRGPAGRESWNGLRGGMRSLMAAAESRLRSDGVAVRTGCAVRRLTPLADNKVRLETGDGVAIHDAVLLTVPGPETSRLLPAGSKGAEFWAGIEYLGVEAVLLLLTRRLSPYYIINLLDESLPFTGIIETTNVLPPEEFGGQHLVYLPKYGSALRGQAGEEATKTSFLAGLKSEFPDLRDDEILDVRIERASGVQPLLPPGPADPFPPETRRPAPGVFVVNTAMITRSPNNMNAALQLGRKAANSLWVEVRQGVSV